MELRKTKRVLSHHLLYRNTKSKFYDLPDIKNNRSTSFGYGNKVDMARTNFNTPSPLNYTINGEFDSMKNKKGGITFGAGRDVIFAVIMNRLSRT